MLYGSKALYMASFGSSLRVSFHARRLSRKKRSGMANPSPEMTLTLVKGQRDDLLQRT